MTTWRPGGTVHLRSPEDDETADRATRTRSGCASPASGEIRPVSLPEPGPDEVLVRTLRSGVSRGTETLVFRGGVPPSQYAAMRAPFQDGDFPGPVKYGYLNVGVVEHGPPTLRGRTVFCLYPHQTAYVVPAGVGRRRARRRAAGARGAGRHGRDRGQRAVGRRPARRRPGHRRRRRHGRLLRRAPARAGSRASQVTLVDVDPAGPSVAAALGVDFALPADAAGGLRPRRAHQRDVGRAAAVAGPARAGGHGHRPQLVRRPRGHAVPRRRLPLRAARHPRQPGRQRVARPGAARRTPRRPAGARARAAARSRLRRAAHRELAASTSCPRSWPGWPTGSLPALCHTIIYGEG